MRKKSPESRESSLASGWTIEAESTVPAASSGLSATLPPEADPDPDAVTADPDAADPEVSEPEQLSNMALVFLGVLGGLFLMYSWIWLSWAQYYAGANAQTAAGAGSLGGVLQQIVFWAAPLAPILWFASAVLLNRRRFRRTVLWILIGAVVLVPLPVFSGMAGGS